MVPFDLSDQELLKLWPCKDSCEFSQSILQSLAVLLPNRQRQNI